MIEQIVAGLLSFIELQMKEIKWKRAFIQNLSLLWARNRRVAKIPN